MFMFVSHPYVTNRDYKRFRPEWPLGNLMPVVNISAIDADEYCKWAGGRLPTSEELDGQFCPVWEWTSTEEGQRRLVQGGSWLSLDDYATCASRYDYDPVNRSFNIGFRCMMI